MCSAPDGGPAGALSLCVWRSGRGYSLSSGPDSRRSCGGLGPARLGLRPVHGSRWLFGNLLGDWFRRRLWGSFANLDSPVSRRRLARVRVRAGVVMVVTNDRNLTGQLGDRDGVTIAASPPAPSGRGAGDPCLASNSATEICRLPELSVSGCGPVMVCCLSIGWPRSDQLADLRRHAPKCAQTKTR